MFLKMCFELFSIVEYVQCQPNKVISQSINKYLLTGVVIKIKIMHWKNIFAAFTKHIN